MFNNISSKDIFLTLIRSPLLRSILFLLLAVTILVPTYSTLFLMPKFVNQLIQNIESDALRTGRHLSNQLPYITEELSKTLITDDFLVELHKAINDFEIADLKIFNANGEVIYSTKPKEIGDINKNSYFLNIVAKGVKFSKIVLKEDKSMEGVSRNRDVAEIYVPIMSGNTFRGAIEIYYDVTERKQVLSRLLINSSILIFSINFMVLGFSVLSLWKASSAMIQRDRAEFKLHEANQFLEERVAKQTHELKVTQRISIEALASLAEYFDSETGAHLHRIQKYTMILATSLSKKSVYATYINNSPGYLDDLELASMLHDIGKTSISKDILAKPAKLTTEEFEQVKQHTVIAGEVLLKANSIFVECFGKDSYLALARDIAKYHHERWNGKGYPLGLQKEDIPLSARIIALVDVYDALRSRRPYKDIWNHEDAVAEIVRERGNHFDPFIVDTFLEIADKFETISEAG